MSANIRLFLTFALAIMGKGQRYKPRELAAPSLERGGDLLMELVIQVVMLATSVAGLVTAMIKAVSEALLIIL